jgi:hypothetical protein
MSHLALLVREAFAITRMMAYHESGRVGDSVLKARQFEST